MGAPSEQPAPPRPVAAIAGTALTRFGIFEAGMASTEEPRYVVVPQRQRLGAAAPVLAPIDRFRDRLAGRRRPMRTTGP